MSTIEDRCATDESAPPPRTCPRPHWRLDGRTGRMLRRPCGSPKCSYECRALWGRRWFAVVLDRVPDLLATDPRTRMWFLRLSVRSVLVESGAHPEVSDTVRGLCLGRFRERLRRRARKRCLALFIIGVHEWSNGRPHLHVLLITAMLFSEDELWALWKASC